MEPMLRLSVFFMHMVYLSLAVSSSLSSSETPFCHKDDKTALLEFKNSFAISPMNPSGIHISRSPVEHWMVDSNNETSSNCCSWEGVECEDGTGRVSALYLSGSSLFGIINSSSSLFRLVHLRSIDLSLNHFNYSTVPFEFGLLSGFTHLDLSHSYFSGQLPPSIFQLPNLEYINLEYNPDLAVILPEFNSTSPMQKIKMDGSRLSGRLPTSISTLQSLEELELGTDDDYCSLTGTMPSSMGNLRKLRYLAIRGCKLTGTIPSSFVNLTELTDLYLLNSFVSPQNLSSFSWLGKLNNLRLLILEGIHLQGEIPPFIGNMSQLIGLHLSNNELCGSIPSQLANLGQLDRLSFAVNELSGYIPSWLSNMTALTLLNLAFNKLQGPIPSWITEVPSLSMLHLGWNQFNGMELNLNSSAAEINRQDYSVGLASCNLREFPSFLQRHPGLFWLDLSHNNIQGEVPSWMHGIGVDTFYFLNISNNYLTGFDPTLDYLPWNALRTLDISTNMFLGSPPVPSPSAKVQFYLVSNNNLTGEFPSRICNWSFLVVLDLSFNNLTGSLPDCLGNISSSLTVLNLQHYAFTGNLPQLQASGMQLAMIALGHNHLLGRLPKSLAKCSSLEFIDIGNNQIEDTFPSWLGSLPVLRVTETSPVLYPGSEVCGSSTYPTTNSMECCLHKFSKQ